MLTICYLSETNNEYCFLDKILKHGQKRILLKLLFLQNLDSLKILKVLLLIEKIQFIADYSRCWLFKIIFFIRMTPEIHIL